MGIERHDMRSILLALRQELAAPRGKLLILGDAKIHFTPGDLVALAAEMGVNLAAIPETLDPFALGQALGFQSVDTLDINGKASLNVDLQAGMPQDLLGKFDCVIDAGVLFWCYEPGAALKNIYRLVKKGGLIAHITAVSGHYGRGYYNIHPLLFEDFYLSNHCEYIHSSYRTKPRHSAFTGRLRSLLTFMGLDDSVSYSFRPGNVYLDRSSVKRITFASTLRLPESSMIPNNVVGTFVFKKLETAEPKGPLRLC